jgi:hypothetical protein
MLLHAPHSEDPHASPSRSDNPYRRACRMQIVLLGPTSACKIPRPAIVVLAVAGSTQRDKVALIISSATSSRDYVMNIEVFSRSAPLAFPPIAV